MADNEYSSINCPACGQEMKQIFLKNQGVTVDVCEKCGGVYFDNRELEKCDESFENASEILDFIKEKSFVNVDKTQVRVCPVCGANMVKNHTNLRRDIEIDVCYSCGGKFLDSGELSKIRSDNDEDHTQENLVMNNILSSAFEMEEDYIKHENKKSPLSYIVPIVLIVAALSCIIFFLLKIK